MATSVIIRGSWGDQIAAQVIYTTMFDDTGTPNIVEIEGVVTSGAGRVLDATAAEWDTDNLAGDSWNSNNVAVGPFTIDAPLFMTLGPPAPNTDLESSCVTHLHVNLPNQALDFKVNFRETPGFVTDDPDTCFVEEGATYPTVQLGFTFGWIDSDFNAPHGRDRDAGVDARFAGVFLINNGAAFGVRTFQIDLEDDPPTPSEGGNRKRRYYRRKRRFYQ